MPNPAPGTACPTCKFFACICGVKERHAEDCLFRISMVCPVEVECEHGYGVCPECDPCTCGAGAGKEDFGG